MKRKTTPSSLNENAPEHDQIQVSVRVRPIRSQFSRKTLKVIDHGVALHFKDKIHQLYFDSVFDQTCSQAKVFEGACLPTLKNVIQGNNGCIFVYGQTGSGKTYTMGTLQTIKRQDQGLIPLTLNYLINHFSQNYDPKDWSISLSFMQIYMEQIIDLLNPRNARLQIRQDLEFGETYVQDLVIVPITNYQQSIDLINAGLEFRKVGNQKMNQLSSRSHTIFTVYLSQKISSTQYMSSNFCMIDLAGSQRVKKSNSTGLRLEQAKFINTSLSALGNVISGLAENNSERFIPYRSSKLTRILKNSLLGKSRVSVICTVQSSQENIYETYSTLIFADRCKQIRLQNQPTVNIQSFYDMQADRDLRIALQKSHQKQKQYQDLIKNLQDPSRVSNNTQRQIQLSGIIQSIYRLFGQINGHLKKVLHQNKNQYTSNNNQSPPKQQKQKVTSATSIQSIKTHLTDLAKETIQHINVLSTMAFGENKEGQSIGTSNKMQTQLLISLLLDSMRQNLKLYEANLIKEGKQSLQKQIALQEYEKQKKQEVLTKIKSKKLKSLQNSFEEIWTDQHSSSNPLQTLLNNIRRGQVGLYGQRKKRELEQKQHTNPKQFLKMLTRQQSQRKNKEMLIEQDSGTDQRHYLDESEQKKSLEEMGNSSITNSQIRYFQKSRKSDLGKSKQQPSISIRQQQKTANSQIKKLLESLIASKQSFEQKKKLNFDQ